MYVRSNVVKGIHTNHLKLRLVRRWAVYQSSSITYHTSV